MRARLEFWRSGASGMGANAVDRKSIFFVFKISARPSKPPLRALTAAVVVDFRSGRVFSISDSFSKTFAMMISHRHFRR